jgi:hypothetical protein
MIMASRRTKARSSRKAEPQREALPPAVPPPDNPLLRELGSESWQGFDSREAAKQRLKALEHSRAMRTSDNDAQRDE